MKGLILSFALLITVVSAEDVRLLDLDPPEAQQQIESHDQSLHYAPKIESNVPAVRYLGNQPHNVVEDIYLARQYHGQDGLGGYLYGYNIPDIAKTEKKVAGGDLTGAYNYKADTGDEIKVQYWDDGTGFHQVDNVGDLLKSKQVQDTPEVQAEKEKFFARWNEEAIRNQEPVKDVALTDPAKSVYQYQPSSSSNVYQQSPQYQQPGSGQYYQSSQSGYQQPGQIYQTSQSHESSATQYSFSKGNPNQIDYTGAYSENQNSYSNPAQAGQAYVGSQYHQSGNSNPAQTGQTYVGSQYQQDGHSNPAQSGQAYVGGQYQQDGSSNYDHYDTSGQYNEKSEETGPPKGFFYNFEYPVGKIVQKGASVGDLHDIYSSNKDKYEGQLNAAYHH